jgi:hypothetical protein
MAGEQRVLAIERDGADGALDGVGIDLDTPPMAISISPAPAACWRASSPTRSSPRWRADMGFAAAALRLARQLRDPLAELRPGLLFFVTGGWFGQMQAARKLTLA